MKRKQRKATDLVGPLQAHGDAQAVVPDHGECLAQQQDDVLTGLHHLEVGLILHGLLHIHLKDDNHENRESGGQAGVTGSSLYPTRLPACRHGPPEPQVARPTWSQHVPSGPAPCLDVSGSVLPITGQESYD